MLGQGAWFKFRTHHLIIGILRHSDIEVVPSMASLDEEILKDEKCENDFAKNTKTKYGRKLIFKKNSKIKQLWWHFGKNKHNNTEYYISDG